jgi:drug/metabolite transporter (DMT)-like permease
MTQGLGSLLLVTSAALHAGWNALLKREPDKLVAVVAVLAVADLAAVAASVLTTGLYLPAGSLVWALIAGACEAGYFVALAFALSRASYGLAYTVSRGGAMLMVWIVSALWLHERVDVLILSGVAVLFSGLLVANRVSRAGSSAAAPAQPLRSSYLAALFIGGYHLAYGRALERGAAPAPLFAVALLLALPVTAVGLGRANARAAWHALLARPFALGSAGILTTASFVMFLGGLARTGAGAAITLRNTSILFAQAFAWMLGERVSARQALGAGLVVSGAALVAMSH